MSRTEREFLTLLVNGPRESAERRVAEAFPNPAYRRKLLWGIRRKAGRWLLDWELYVAASDREERLLSRPVVPAHGDPPLYVDPLVAALVSLGRRLGGRRAVGTTRPSPPPGRG